MARKWFRRLSCCFAILAMLPGCQLLPISARAPASDAPPRSESAHEISPGLKYFMTAGADDGNQRSESKKGAAPILPDATGPKAGVAGSGAPAGPQMGVPGFVIAPDLPVTATGPPTQKVVTLHAEPVSMALPQIVSAEKKPNEYAPLVRALQCILEDRNREAIQHLQAYDRDTQEFFLQLLPALTILVKTPIDKLTPPQIAVLNGQLDGIQQKLRPRSELIVSKMRYARRIHAFASYEEVPDNHAFLAGAKDRPGEEVLLYIELKNFASEPTREGDFLTSLAVTLELKDANGKVAWTHSYPRSRTMYSRKTRLNDFCSGYSFYVPDLPPGVYQLWIQIIDESIPEIRRVTRKSLDFRVTPVAEPATPR